MQEQRLHLKEQQSSSLSSENVFLRFSPSSPSYTVVSKSDSSLNVKHSEDSTTGDDVETELYACIESLDAVVEPESKIWKDVKTLDDILRHFVSNVIVKSRPFLTKTFSDRLHTWQHETQADLKFLPNFLKFLDSRLNKGGCCALRKIQINRKRKSTNISKCEKVIRK